MNKIFAPFLPPWAETGLQPAFYDVESGTVLQQTARMYDKVNQLTRLFNELSEETRETVEEYIGKFTELKDFVDEYFDNLDVQEEINKKLDEMVVGGELQQLLTEQYTALKTSVNNTISEFEAEVNSNIVGLNNKLNNTNTGNPIPVASTDNMTDTTKVYLLISTGKWYYYDGDSWEIGGDYQSTVIGEGTVNANSLESGLATSLGIVSPSITWESGHYRDNNGVEADHAAYSMSDNISLAEGDTIYILANVGTGSISVIAPVTSDGNPVQINASTMNVKTDGNITKVYSYTAPFAVDVSLSIKNSNSYAYCFIEKSKDEPIVKSILNYRIPSITINYHYYVNGDTVNEHNKYAYTEPIQMYTGETIKFHARGEGNVVSLLRLVSSDGTFISTIQQTSGTGEYDVSYTTSTDCYVSICSDLAYFRDLYITKKNTTHEYNKDLFASFIKFGVIGDSLASGESVANNGGTNQYIDNYDYSWGQFIARNHGMTCVNFSKGGATTRSWLNPASDWGLPKLLNPDNKCNAYIIALGVNDPSIPGYLGSVADIHLDDFKQNADTFYGNYARIIGYIKQVQPKAKIFMLTMPSDWGDYLTAIRTIAGLYDKDVYLIDLNRDYYNEFTSGFISQCKRQGHFNSIGYNYIGELLYDAFTDYMYNDQKDFDQIEFIGTNYSYSE